MRPSISFVLLMIAIIVAGAGAVTWALVRPDSRSVEFIVPTPGPMTVHVTGEVQNPGLYTLQPGSRVADAVDAAGGLLQPSNINLAAPVRDGQQLVVSAALPAGTDQEVEPGEPSASNVLLDLNTANADQLEQLPNIGATRAASIIGFRDRNGPILFVDDLTAIDGIGPSTIEGIRPHVIQP